MSIRNADSPTKHAHAFLLEYVTQLRATLKLQSATNNEWLGIQKKFLNARFTLRKSRIFPFKRDRILTRLYNTKKQSLVGRVESHTLRVWMVVATRFEAVNAQQKLVLVMLLNCKDATL